MSEVLGRGSRAWFSGVLHQRSASARFSGVLHQRSASAPVLSEVRASPIAWSPNPFRSAQLSSARFSSVQFSSRLLLAGPAIQFRNWGRNQTPRPD
ncbi:MAG: hypothetical protein IT288_02145 [Bdellovibrionales bacterium]|nr:hypothetical protein [Bdellovibrionales bacterium]